MPQSVDDEILASEMAALRDRLIAALEAHDRRHHDGRACLYHRANALAFLAHSLGFDPGTEAWRAVTVELAFYFQEHLRHHTEADPHV